MAVLLKWYDPNSIETGVRVYRSESTFDENSLPTPLVDLPADTREHQDNTVAIGTTYYYMVESYNASGSEFTPLLTITAEATSNVFVADSGGNLYKYDPAGVQLWTMLPYAVNITVLDVDHRNRLHVGHGNGLNRVYEENDTTWLFKVDIGTAITDNRVVASRYVTADDNTIKMYYVDGEYIWGQTLTGPIYGVDMDDAFNVYLGDGDEVVKRDLDNTELWRVSTGANNITHLRLIGNEVFYSVGSTLGAYDTAGVETIAVGELGHGTIQGIESDGTSVFVAFTNAVAKYDIDMVEQFSISIPRTVEDIDVDEGGGIFVVSGGYLSRYDSSGGLVWEIQVSGTTTMRAVSQDRVQVGLFAPYRTGYNGHMSFTLTTPDISDLVVSTIEHRFNYNTQISVIAPPEIVSSPLEERFNYQNDVTI